MSLGIARVVAEGTWFIPTRRTPYWEGVFSSLSALTGMFGSLDLHSYRHSTRVAQLSIALGADIGHSESDLALIGLGGLLHDLGKLTVSKRVLLKPGSLTNREFELVREHPARGARILSAFEPLNVPFIRDIVLHHHERLDGSGYPDGLIGAQLGVAVRIVAVADVFDALTSNRPYRSAMGSREAVDILQRESDEGRLDAEVVALVRRYVLRTKTWTRLAGWDSNNSTKAM